MRNQMQPGTGVRTIGGMYATVKEVHDDTVLLEVAPGVHADFRQERHRRGPRRRRSTTASCTAIGDLKVDGADRAGRRFLADRGRPRPPTPLADGAKIDLGKKPEADDAAAETDGRRRRRPTTQSPRTARPTARPTRSSHDRGPRGRPIGARRSPVVLYFCGGRSPQHFVAAPRTTRRGAVGQGETRRWQHRRGAEGPRGLRAGRGAPWL